MGKCQKNLSKTYKFVIQNIETQEIDDSIIFLKNRDANQMSKKINEIVYSVMVNNELHQWKLIKIKKIENEKIIK